MVVSGCSSMATSWGFVSHACPFSVRHRVPFSPHGYKYYTSDIPLTWPPAFTKRARRRCDARATWRRREGARWLHFTPTSLALIVTYSTLHTTHLAARAAPSRPRSSPRWSSEVEGSARNALSCTCDRGQTRVADDLWRKGARKGEQSRCGAMTSGWALLMISKVGIGYNMATDSTSNMWLLTCRVVVPSVRGGAHNIR